MDRIFRHIQYTSSSGLPTAEPPTNTCSTNFLKGVHVCPKFTPEVCLVALQLQHVLPSMELVRMSLACQSGTVSWGTSTLSPLPCACLLQFCFMVSFFMAAVLRGSHSYEGMITQMPVLCAPAWQSAPQATDLLLLFGCLVAKRIQCPRD